MALQRAHPIIVPVCSSQLIETLISKLPLQSITCHYHAKLAELCFPAQSLQYVWLEGWSEDYQRPFFYNQESKQSSWDRPPDLAWRRIAIETQQS